MAMQTRGGINVTPMIDVLLVLLILFMVITPLTPHGEPAAVPQAPRHGEPATPPDEHTVVLSLAADGRIHLNEEPLASRQDLATRLQKIFAQRRDRVLFLRAARDTEFELVARVVDEAKWHAKVALMPVPAGAQ